MPQTHSSSSSSSIEPNISRKPFVDVSCCVSPPRMRTSCSQCTCWTTSSRAEAGDPGRRPGPSRPGLLGPVLVLVWDMQSNDCAFRRSGNTMSLTPRPLWDGHVAGRASIRHEYNVWPRQSVRRTASHEHTITFGRSMIWALIGWTDYQCMRCDLTVISNIV